MKKLLVIDGQGGRMGSLFIEKYRKLYPKDNEIIAIGTNSIATASMLKAGANQAATGENPVLVNAPKADYIIGPIGIIAADALLGEITEKMASAVARSDAKKILIPVNTCGIYVAGVGDNSLSKLIEDAVSQI